MTSEPDKPENAPDRVPDPNGLPEPLPTDDSWANEWRHLFRVTTPIVLAGGALWALIASSTTTCTGATRSARLKWQSRQRQIEETIQKVNQDATDNHG